MLRPERRWLTSFISAMKGVMRGKKAANVVHQSYEGCKRRTEGG
ncbi:hypothetical protein [Robertmurraya korlensis]|nr:hypothetical protein [Robertmurraya korlensis]